MLRSLLPAALVLQGCLTSSVVALAPEAKPVTVVRETDRPGQCRVLGKVQGSSYSSDPKEAREGAENDLRNQTAELKGNFAMIETVRSGKRGTTSQEQVVLGGKALACQTLEMDEADEKRREEARAKKEEEAIKAEQEAAAAKEKAEQEAAAAKEKAELEKAERAAQQKEAAKAAKK